MAVIPLSGKHGQICLLPRLAAADPMRHDRAENFKAAANAAREQGGLREKNNNRHCRRCTGNVGDRGAGAKQAAAETRRHSRHVRALCRYHRRGLGDRREDGGGGLRRRGAGTQGRDRRGRSSQQGRPCRQHRARHARQPGCRDAVRRGGVRHRAGRRRDREGAQQDRDVFRPGLDPPQQRGLRSLHRALRLRHVWAGQRHRARHRQVRASRPGSSSPPTMRSARIWKRTPPMWW